LVEEWYRIHIDLDVADAAKRDTAIAQLTPVVKQLVQTGVVRQVSRKEWYGHVVPSQEHGQIDVT
jgi:hypothetical protein